MALLLTLASHASGMRTDASAHAWGEQEAGGEMLDAALDASLEEVVGKKDCKVPAAVEKRYKGLELLGAGMRGCAYLAWDGPQKVVVKIAKYDNALTNWRYECVDQMQKLHVDACKKGEDQLALAEQYLPACLEVGGTKDEPYLVMQAASAGTLKDVKKLKLSKDEEKSVFAQVVAALYAMHGIGYTHNDAHNKNIMVGREHGEVRVSLIDFGRTKSVEKSEIKNNFHRDANSLLKHAGSLSHCKGGSKQPEKLVGCLQEKWGVDEGFAAALRKVVEGCRQATREQHIGDLYRTAFVQENLPPAQRHYHLPGSCDKK